MMKDAIFKGGQNGLRIKSWARPSHMFVQGVQFLDVVMLNVQNPIVIDQNYCPHNLNCPASGVKVSDVLFQNIQGTSATAIAINLDCRAANPCSRITLENVSLTCNKQVAQSCCNNAIGKTSSLVHPTSCL
ncbi:polygalacturonase-like [Pyrus ussuriensis x Pyrus communis]|uniref:Polygalacturonase-like n=1 Tax=Pyrus ussuriensis x Pyrus communis TaxID=2448454 RepID=A0A5N5GYN5_9ROSA|nr:polygalacturonase-like [Pyrus ussuriensis x Pyrus communis]